MAAFLFLRDVNSLLECFNGAAAFAAFKVVQGLTDMAKEIDGEPVTYARPADLIALLFFFDEVMGDCERALDALAKPRDFGAIAVTLPFKLLAMKAA